MKVDRILEMIIYLMNHDNVPASYLAERFHTIVCRKRASDAFFVCICQNNTERHG